MEPKEAIEIKKWIERLKREYWEMLTYREKIVGQVEVEKAEFARLLEEKKRIGKEITEGVQAELAERIKTKEVKKHIVLDIEEGKREITRTKKELERKRELIFLEEAELSTGRMKLGEDERELIKRTREVWEKEKDMGAMLEYAGIKKVEAERLLSDAVRSKLQAQEIEERKQTELESILKREREIELKEEEQQKQREVLAEKEKELDKQERHIWSQNEALKLSFDELRRMRK